jgi:hypothetical protein
MYKKVTPLSADDATREAERFGINNVSFQSQFNACFRFLASVIAFHSGKAVFQQFPRRVCFH